MCIRDRDPARDTPKCLEIKETVKSDQFYTSPEEAASPQKKVITDVTGAKCLKQPFHIYATPSDSTQSMDKPGTACDAPTLSNIVYCQFDDPMYDGAPSLLDTYPAIVESKPVKANPSVSPQEKASNMDDNTALLLNRDTKSCAGASEYSDPMDLGFMNDNTATVLGNKQKKDAKVGIYEIFDDPTYDIGSN